MLKSKFRKSVPRVFAYWVRRLCAKFRENQTKTAAVAIWKKSDNIHTDINSRH